MSAPGSPSSAGAIAAVDLGATSGRVMHARVGPNTLELTEAVRFRNTPVRVWEGDRAALHWNLTGLYSSVLDGLGAVARSEPGLLSVGVDAWAVDYGLLRSGRMLGEPYHYRDERTAAGVELVHARVAPDELYRQGGLQFLPFNSLYQLAHDSDSGALEGVDRILLVPDLITYWLSGTAIAERTNASTTGLLAADGSWNDELIARLGLRRSLFPGLVDAGTTVGPLLPSLDLPFSGAGPAVTAVGSHDTASAVVAVPMDAARAAYISCGTWGLVGVELEHRVIGDAGRAANFTNEGGVDGRVRYLHNVMGLWLLSESIREWQRRGLNVSLESLLAEAAALPRPRPSELFDADDPRFLTPGDLPSRIAAWFAEHGLRAPASPAGTVRVIVESLAEAFARSVRTAAELSGVPVETVHIVGGGARNALLCQATADRVGLPVLAGPVEATALGNALVQARAAGLVSGDLEALRALVARHHVPVRYDPMRVAAR